ATAPRRTVGRAAAGAVGGVLVVRGQLEVDGADAARRRLAAGRAADGAGRPRLGAGRPGTPNAFRLYAPGQLLVAVALRNRLGLRRPVLRLAPGPLRLGAGRDRPQPAGPRPRSRPQPPPHRARSRGGQARSRPRPPLTGLRRVPPRPISTTPESPDTVGTAAARSFLSDHPNSGRIPIGPSAHPSRGVD